MCKIDTFMYLPLDPSDMVYQLLVIYISFLILRIQDKVYENDPFIYEDM